MFFISIKRCCAVYNIIEKGSHCSNYSALYSNEWTLSFGVDVDVCRSGIDVREHYLLEYASSLVHNTRSCGGHHYQRIHHPHPSYLTLAADYLYHAPVRGKHYLELVHNAALSRVQG
jgi:hypothetical protein